MGVIIIRFYAIYQHEGGVAFDEDIATAMSVLKICSKFEASISVYLSRFYTETIFFDQENFHFIRFLASYFTKITLIVNTHHFLLPFANKNLTRFSTET